jgi:hypothetical protein
MSQLGGNALLTPFTDIVGNVAMQSLTISQFGGNALSSPPLKLLENVAIIKSLTMSQLVRNSHLTP